MFCLFLTLFLRPLLTCFRAIEAKKNQAVFAVKPGDFDDQLNLSVPNRQHLERTFVSAKPDDIAGFAVRTLQIIGVNRAVKDGLAVKKSVFLYCTAGTPKV